MKRHINLKVYSQYTKGETVMTPEQIIQFAEGDLAPAIALTDFNSVRGYGEFFNAAKEYGIKPILGLGTYCRFGKGKKKEITLLAKNRKGLRNIYKLVSISQMRKEAINDEPYMTMEEIENHREGIVVGMNLGWDMLYSLCADLDGVFVCNNRESAEVYYHILLSECLRCIDYVEISPWEQRTHCVEAVKEVDEDKLKQVAKSLVSYLQEKGKYPIAATGGNCYGAMDDLCFEVLHSNETTTKRPLSWLKCTKLVLQDYEMFLDKELAEKIVLDNTTHIADMVDEVVFSDGYIGELRACLKSLVGEDRVYDMCTVEKRIGRQRATEMVEAHCGKPGVDWEDWEKTFVIDSINAMYDGEKEEENYFGRMFFVPRGKDICEKGLV